MQFFACLPAAPSGSAPNRADSARYPAPPRTEPFQSRLYLFFIEKTAPPAGNPAGGALFYLFIPLRTELFRSAISGGYGGICYIPPYWPLFLAVALILRLLLGLGVLLGLDGGCGCEMNRPSWEGR